MSMQEVSPAAEVVCGALHRAEFKFLTETDGGRVTWFQRGVSPKALRVSVERLELVPYVYVNMTFLNISQPGNWLKVSQQVQVHCVGSVNDINQAAIEAAVRVLEVYKDILNGTGDCSAESAKASIAHTSEYDVDS